LKILGLKDEEFYEVNKTDSLMRFLPFQIAKN
jgi:hypothetical protein